MALIKCPECGNDISDKAKKCPHCGYDKERKYCPECGTMLAIDDAKCSNCGYTFNKVVEPAPDNGENYALAIAGLILSFNFSLMGLIFGIIVLVANKGKKNNARNFALAATIISSISLIINIIVYIIYTVLKINYPYY